MGTIVRPDLPLSSSSSTSHPYEKVKVVTQAAKHASLNSPRFKDLGQIFQLLFISFVGRIFVTQ